MPISWAWAGRSILFCCNGFWTITEAALITPTRLGSSCVPPHAGTRPRETSGSATAATPEESVR
jgi:hypothetical protein